MMKKILILCFCIFTFAMTSKAQSIVTVNQYNVPYTIYGDSIKADTVSVIVDFRFSERFDLTTQTYATTSDTVSADVDVFRSNVNVAASYVPFWSDSLHVDAVAVAKDTANYSKFVKFTINGSDTAVFNIIVKALEPTN